METNMSNEEFMKLVLELQKKYPNDQDLGKKVRELIINNKKN